MSNTCHPFYLFLFALTLALITSPQDSPAQNHLNLMPEASEGAQHHRAPTTPDNTQNEAPAESQAKDSTTRPSPPTAEAPTKRQLYFMSDHGLTNGAYLLEHEKYAAALQVFEDVLERNSRNIDAVAGLGAAYLGLGQTKPAGDEIRKALARDNRHIGANYLLGRYYLAIDRPEQATEQLRVLALLCGRSGCPEDYALQAEIDASRN